MYWCQNIIIFVFVKHKTKDMATGRPRKPRHIKEKQGTLAVSREVSTPLMSERLIAIPTYPKYFNKNERYFYNYTCKILLDLKLLTPQFIIDVILASTWYHVATESADMIRSGNIIKEFDTGHTTSNAWLKAFDTSSAALDKFNNHYGFNLTASQKIEMPSIEDDDNDFIK